MTILAIDTSCDDTCIAILKIKNKKLKIKNFEILSNIISSQVKIHAKYGGVYPSLAKREHQRNLIPVLKRALEEPNFLKSKVKGQKAKIEIEKLEKILEREEYLFKKLKIFLVKYQKPKIDLIAVTVGPGLEPCLWTGVNFAKALSYLWQLPIIPVNHIEAHIFANLLSQIRSKSKIPEGQAYGAGKNQKSKIKFPAICLAVSGGHTQLILMKDFGKYKILGETRDDAAGECFDKVARILGLGYPGGPSVAKMATKLKIKNEKPSTRAKLGTGPVPHRNEVSGAGFKVYLPRPMIHQKNFDFSFSGLKTAVLYDFKNRPPKIRQSPKENLRFPTGQAKEYIRAMAAEVQQAIVDVLINKTFRAVKEFNTKTIIIGGGVAANEKLRKQFKVQSLKSKVNFLVPPKEFCTDNAAMVGITAFFHYLKGESRDWQKILVNANLRI